MEQCSTVSTGHIFMLNMITYSFLNLFMGHTHNIAQNTTFSPTLYASLWPEFIQIRSKLVYLSHGHGLHLDLNLAMAVNLSHHHGLHLNLNLTMAINLSHSCRLYLDLNLAMAVAKLSPSHRSKLQPQVRYWSKLSHGHWSKTQLQIRSRSKLFHSCWSEPRL